jgi:hypothetical protein
MCKWPIGDPSTDGFTFCGRRSSEGPYCGEHARIAYQPQQTKKKSGADRTGPLAAPLHLVSHLRGAALVPGSSGFQARDAEVGGRDPRAQVLMRKARRGFRPHGETGKKIPDG